MHLFGLQINTTIWGGLTLDGFHVSEFVFLLYKHVYDMALDNCHLGKEVCLGFKLLPIKTTLNVKSTLYMRAFAITSD